MKNFRLIVIFLLSLSPIAAQTLDGTSEKIVLLAKPRKIVIYTPCELNQLKDEAIVQEFDIIKKEDQLKYGEKLYAILTCIDFPGDGVFNLKYEWNITISETPYFKWNIKVLNPELLDKNIGRKKYWIYSISRTVTTKCGID